MPLTPGEKLGPYEIIAAIGKGGMGEVFRARDPRLGRDVAIKISEEKFSERFDREARAIAALNHPHICTLYDVGPNYLVMELVEGETLAAKLKRGKLPIADTLRFGAQTAAALAEAHSKSITHRDLKPGNIMIGKNGVKVLDFGLARTDGDETLTVPMMIVGTPAYLPPEQAEGSVCDARTDIYALGLILYEMATGKRPPRDQPPSMDGLPDKFAYILERCLPRDPIERWQSALDLSRQLAWANKPDSGGASATARMPRWVWPAAAVLGLAGLAGLGFIFARANNEAAASLGQISFQVFPPEGGEFSSPVNPDHELMAISPDGSKIAFIASVKGQTRLWIREIGQITARPLAGTEGALSPFWSPDSRAVAFFAQGKLKKIAVAGGPPTEIYEVSAAVLEGTWGGGGDILFTDYSARGIFQLSAEGGAAKKIVALDRSRKEARVIWPQFLPDGKRFLYAVQHSDTTHQILIGSLAGGEPKLLMQEKSHVAFAAPGYVLFVRGGALLAQKFNLDELRLEGAPIPIVEQMEYFQPTGLSPFSVSTNGVLAYHGVGAASRLAWLDRNGRELAGVTPPGDTYTFPRLSPDGKKLVAEKRDPRIGTTDLYVFDLLSGTPTRITSDPGHEANPEWSPNSRKIAFGWDHNAPPFLHQIALDSSGVAEPLTQPLPEAVQLPTAWLRDGSVIFQDVRPETGQDLWILPGEGERKPRPILSTPFNETSATVSPDGRWMAYVADDSGQPQVYLRSFPQIGAPQQISKNGGLAPRWARNGHELYFIEGDRLMAASVGSGATVDAGSPAVLFQKSPGIVDFDVAADGRFLVAIGKVGFIVAPITVVTNWTNALK